MTCNCLLTMNCSAKSETVFCEDSVRSEHSASKLNFKFCNKSVVADLFYFFNYMIKLKCHRA